MFREENSPCGADGVQHLLWLRVSVEREDGLHFRAVGDEGEAMVLTAARKVFDQRLDVLNHQLKVAGTHAGARVENDTDILAGLAVCGRRRKTDNSEESLQFKVEGRVKPLGDHL